MNDRAVILSRAGNLCGCNRHLLLRLRFPARRARAPTAVRAQICPSRSEASGSRPLTCTAPLQFPRRRACSWARTGQGYRRARTFGAQETFIELRPSVSPAMDAQAVDMEILSINTFWYNRETRSRSTDREAPERKAGRILRRATPIVSRGLCLAHLAGRPDLAVQGAQRSPSRSRDSRAPRSAAP